MIYYRADRKVEYYLKQEEKVYELTLLDKGYVTVVAKIIRELDIVLKKTYLQTFIMQNDEEKEVDIYISKVEPKEIDHIPYVGNLVTLKASKHITIYKNIRNLFNLKTKAIINGHIFKEQHESKQVQIIKYETVRQKKVYQDNRIQIPAHMLKAAGIYLKHNKENVVEMHMEFGRIVIQVINKEGKIGYIKGIIKETKVVYIPTSYIKVLNIKEDEDVNVGLYNNKIFIEKIVK